MNKSGLANQFDQTYLRELHRLVNRMEKSANLVLAPQELSFSGYQVLASLSQHPDFLQAQIAEDMNVTPAVITRQIAQLGERGYVKQVQDPENRRRNLLTLTPAGKQAVEQATVQINQVFQPALKALQGGDLALFTRCIAKLNTTFED